MWTLKQGRQTHRQPYIAFSIVLLVLLKTALVTRSQDVTTPIPDLRPGYTYIGCYKLNLDILKEHVFSGAAQTCIEICEKLNFRYAVLTSEKCFCDNKLNESEKLDATFCNVRCTRNKSHFCGGVAAMSYYSTLVTKPPRNLRLLNRTENSLIMHWDELHKADDDDLSFLIKAYVTKTFSRKPLYPQPEYIVQRTENHFEITDLHPGTEYNVTIKAMCRNDVCGQGFVIGETMIGTPDPPPKEPKILNRTDTTITVELKPGYNNNGPITYHRLIVQRIDDALIQTFDEELLGGYHRSLEDGTPYYITAELDFVNETRQFVVGDGRSYRGFFNAPIPKDAHIHISLGVISSYNGTTKARYAIASHKQHDAGFVFADFEEGEESVLALIIACVIFGVLLVLSVITYFYLRYKTSNRRHRLSDTHELTLQGPMVEVENNGFVKDELTRTGDFRTELNSIVDNLDSSQRFARNAIRLNIDNVIAKGNFGEVISGKLYTDTGAFDCQVHVVSDDMEAQDQGLFLNDLDQIVRIMPHEKFVDFLGVSASPDWFYVMFENISPSLKKRLVDSRVPPSLNNSRFSAISEECVLQWIYDIAVAMEYLEVNKVVHKKLCSYNVYVAPSNAIKVSLFGPTPFADLEGKSIDISRWLAPEVLRFQHHSSKSDVWSFACLAWECCTLGGTPFASITSQDLLPRIKNGSRPEQPSFVFNDLYQLFLNCWQLEPSDRSDFEEIAFNVRQILTSPRHALSFDRHEKLQLPYYLPLLELEN